MLRRSVFSLLVLAVVAGEASAQPVGSEFRVNTYTTGYQYVSAVAADGNGNFVVVWHDDGQDGYFSGIFGQRFDQTGQPLGGEFGVNLSTYGYQFSPRVAARSSGFVVVWTGLDSDAYGIFARLYDASGVAQTGEIPVNSVETDFQLNSDVALGPGGTFVVTWDSYGPDGDGFGVFGQRFDASGSRLGAEFQVNTYTAYYQVRPAVAVAPTGAFVVTWVSDFQDGSGYGVFARRFDAAANALGSEFRVNTNTSSEQDGPDVAVDAAGNFVVVWDSRFQDGSDYGLFGQRFDANGSVLGAEFAINTYTTNRQWIASLAGEADGDFVVTWTSTNQLGASSGDEVFAQMFDAAGSRRGTEFRVNVYTTNLQRRPAVAPLGNEKFVVTWTSGLQDGDGEGIFGRVWSDLIFANGFNAGP